jgi:hypothetical protein
LIEEAKIGQKKEEAQAELKKVEGEEKKVEVNSGEIL